MHLHLFLLVLISVEVVVVVFATQDAVVLGANAPPAIFDGWTMTAVPVETREYFIMVPDAEGLDPSDPIIFNPEVQIVSEMIYSEVGRYTAWEDTLEIFFPQDTCAFIFYVMTNDHLLVNATFNIQYAFGNIITQDIQANDFHKDAFGFAASYCLKYGKPVSVSITQPGQLVGFIVGKFLMSQCGPDTDGDCVPDLVDNCPNDANLGQCDYDGDGIGDVCDPCILGANDVDRDNDGVPDACDKCPGFDDSQDRDGDGIPDLCDFCPDDDNYLDTDGDGIPDCIDNCVHSPNADQADVDSDGIGDACDHNDACCINDCNGVATGNYQSCISCSVYVTCNWGNLIDNRPCPGGLYWDANRGGCVRDSGTCDPNRQSTPCPSP